MPVGSHHAEPSIDARTVFDSRGCNTDWEDVEGNV